MRVLLPSHGIYGQTAVNMKTLTIEDMIEMSKYNKNDFLRRIEVVRRVSDVKLDKITWCDLCYLYDICCFSLMRGQIEYNVKCPVCGEVTKQSMYLADLEIEELPRRFKNPMEVVSMGKTYKFRLLRASDVLDAVDQSMYADDEETELLLSKTALIFGMQATDIDFAKSLNLSQIVAATEFDRFYYHGFVRVGHTVCGNSSCNHEFDIRFDTPTSLVSLDPKSLLDSYTGLADYISYSDILRLSLEEFNYFVDQLNDKFNNSNA